MKHPLSGSITELPNDYKKWRLVNHGVADSHKILVREEGLAYQVGEGKLPPVLETWVASRKCFVLGNHYAKKLENTQLMERVRQQGIPVVIRSSGGEAFLHDSTCLNVGVMVPRQFYPHSFAIDRAFALFSSGIVHYLRAIKVPVYSGKTKTFCPGPHDLLVRGRKIAGISLLLRDNFYLVHGTLLINAQDEYRRKLQLFYPSLEEEFTSLRIITGRWLKMEQVTSCIIQSYQARLNITFDREIFPASNQRIN